MQKIAGDEACGDAHRKACEPASGSFGHLATCEQNSDRRWRSQSRYTPK
jgi:hypothetical protein